MKIVESNALESAKVRAQDHGVVCYVYRTEAGKDVPDFLLSKEERYSAKVAPKQICAAYPDGTVVFF